MYYLLLDIETTGLKKDNDYPNIVQVAFQMIDSGLHLVEEDWFNSVKLKHSFIIKPSGYEISLENSLIHGITNKYASDNGIELEDVISKLNRYIYQYQPILVAHNAEFDINILKYYGLNEYVSYFCTMKYLSDIRFNENDKYLKLTELFAILFSKEINQQHDALKDVEILYECLKELFAKKILDEYDIREVANRISFEPFFKTFNKLKVLKSNVTIANRFYGLVGLNGASFYAHGPEVDECTYLTFKEVDGCFHLALMSSCEVQILKCPLDVDNYGDFSHLDKRECLKQIYSDLNEFDHNKKILKHRFILGTHNRAIIWTKNYKLTFNNSFFIGNKYNINGKDITHYIEPSWEKLHQNDVIGFIDDNCVVFLIKNDNNKFKFCISHTMFEQVTKQYKGGNGNFSETYMISRDFNKNDNSILKYFNQLAKS